MTDESPPFMGLPVLYDERVPGQVVWIVPPWREDMEPLDGPDALAYAIVGRRVTTAIVARDRATLTRAIALAAVDWRPPLV